MATAFAPPHATNRVLASRGQGQGGRHLTETGIHRLLHGDRSGNPMGLHIHNRYGVAIGIRHVCLSAVVCVHDGAWLPAGGNADRLQGGCVDEGEAAGQRRVRRGIHANLRAGGRSGGLALRCGKSAAIANDERPSVRRQRYTVRRDADRDFRQGLHRIDVDHQQRVANTEGGIQALTVRRNREARDLRIADGRGQRHQFGAIRRIRVRAGGSRTNGLDNLGQFDRISLRPLAAYQRHTVHLTGVARCEEGTAVRHPGEAQRTRS